MTVDRAHARHLAEHDGVVYAFCSMGCRTRFIKEPAAFLAAPGPTPWRPHEVRGHRRHQGAARPRLGVRLRPAQVAACGPGVESVEMVDETHYKTIAKIGVGFISARFNGDIEIVEQVPPDRMVIKVHGQAPGSAADAVASMALRDGSDGATDHGLLSRREHLGHARLRGCAAHRGYGQQARRPDVRLHPSQAGDVTRALVR
jgi:YHS domain-containing protein